MPLGSHLNVYNSCLFILRERGFKLEINDEPNADGSYSSDVLWCAEKDGFRFMADNPIELIGLIAVYDYVKPEEDKPYWWHIEGRDGPDIWQEMLSGTFKFNNEGID